MVSCCVLWNSKITETVHEGVTKFVWQLGRYEPSYPVGCCALLCDYSGPWPPARQGVREDNRARFPLVEVAPQGRARVSLDGNRFHSLRHYTVKKVGSKWVRATRLTNFAHYVLLKLPTFNHIFSPKISQPTIEKATYETSSAAEKRDKMFSVFDENHWNLLLVNVFGMNRRIFCILNRT